MTTDRDALNAALRALEANHKHHQDYDEYNGYPKSTLETQNCGAIAMVTSALAAPPVEQQAAALGGMFPRDRLSSMKVGGIDRFETASGFRAWMGNDGAGAVEIVGKDSAGRHKSVATEMSADDMLRLHHTLGEALKSRGAFVKLEPEKPAAQAGSLQFPEDFITHHAAWRNALQLMAQRPSEEGHANYWQHELRAYDRAYQELVTKCLGEVQALGSDNVSLAILRAAVQIPAGTITITRDPDTEEAKDQKR